MPSLLRTLTWALLACLLLSSYAIQSVSAESEEAEGEHGDAEEIKTEQAGEVAEDAEDLETSEAEGVLTTSLFPKHTTRHFPAGETIEALIAFENQNEKDDFSIEYVRGALTSPQDFGHYLQNFTGSLHNTTVQKGQEACLLYRFTPDVNIDPREYGVIIEVFYQNENNETFLSTVFNGTVHITDPHSSFDGQTLFAYLSIVGFTGLIGFGAWKFSGGKRAKTRRAPRSENVKTGSTDIDWEFVAPEHVRYARGQSKGAKSPTSPKSPKSPKSPIKSPKPKSS